MAIVVAVVSLTDVSKATDNDLIEPHRWLDDFDLVAALCCRLRHQKHVREQEAVNISLRTHAQCTQHNNSGAARNLF